MKRARVISRVGPITVIHDMAQSFVAMLVPCECIMAYNGQKQLDRLDNVFRWINSKMKRN